MFYDFRQNNSGGSFVYDDERGLSVNVIIEADSVRDAHNRAEKAGIYFDGCSTGRDCSYCGDRWSELWVDDGTEVPSLYGHPVEPNQNFPAEDEGVSWAWKSRGEGEAEGFIHYKDGRIEPFYQVTNPRKDLDGSYGWGVTFSKNGHNKFLVGKDGYDETGNQSVPWGKYEGSGKPPAKANKVLKFNDQYSNWVLGWYRNEEDADKIISEIETLTTLRLAVQAAIGGSNETLENANTVWKSQVAASSKDAVKIMEHIY